MEDKAILLAVSERPKAQLLDGGSDCRPEAAARRREHLVGWMRVALAVGSISNCPRAQYGTVVLDVAGRVVTTGRNGKPRGACNDATCYRENLPRGLGIAAHPCCIHAEANALIFGNFSEYQGGTLIVSGQPCMACALLIMQSGVSTLVVLEDNRPKDGLKVLEEYGASLEVIELSRSEIEEHLCEGKEPSASGRIR
jgi:deoxycytidylate deaminase